VTGIQKNLAAGLAEKLREIKTVSPLPVAVGFGVSEPSHVKQLSGRCDAIVVGSAIVKKIEEKGNVCQFVQSLTKEL
jgi:tryptophan synthase alpha chain